MASSRTPAAATAAAAALCALLLAAALPAACAGKAQLQDSPYYGLHRVDTRSLLAEPAPAAKRYGAVVADNATCGPVDDALLGGFEGALQRFSQSVQIPTVTQAAYKDTWHAVNLTNMLQFQEFIKESFPEVTGNVDPDLRFETVGGGNLSMLVTWEGSDPALDLPVLIGCHYDVVPTDKTRAATTWDHPPYSGYLDREKGIIYGRGTVDNKGQCMALLEAATVLYKSGWKPKRTLLFVLNQDEESSGTFGANTTLHETLLPRYPDGFEAVWDEGVGMVQNFRDNRVIAQVAVAEKGQQFVNVIVNAVGGHSSSAPDDGSAMGDILGRVFTAITAAPVPDEVPLYVQQFVESMAEILTPEEMDVIRAQGDMLEQADALFNLNMGITTIDELRRGVKSKAYQSWVRTKRALTKLNAGTSENTLPQVAALTFNFRTLHPWSLNGTDGPSMIQYFEDALADMNDTLLGVPGGYNVSYGPTDREYGIEAAMGTDTNSTHWKVFKQTLQDVLTQDGEPVSVAAGLMFGATDSRYWQKYAKQGSLRLFPYVVSVADAKRVHGDNEQLSIASWRQSICVAHELIKAYGDLPTQ